MPSDAKFVKLLYVHHFYTCNITVYIFSTFYFVSLCVFYVVFSITDNSNIVLRVTVMWCGINVMEKTAVNVLLYYIKR